MSALFLCYYCVFQSNACERERETRTRDEEAEAMPEEKYPLMVGNDRSDVIISNRSTIVTQNRPISEYFRNPAVPILTATSRVLARTLMFIIALGGNRFADDKTPTPRPYAVHSPPFAPPLRPCFGVVK